MAAAACLAALTAAGQARADVSSWLYAGTGASMLSQQKGSYEVKPTLQFDLGMGTPSSRSVVVGGLFRMVPYLGKGTDLALVARIASQGYALGTWGVALDAGGYQRWWGPGSQGFTGSVMLGAPWGLTLALNAGLGAEQDRTFGAIIGVDLLRLTVHRLGGEAWWANPRPAWRPE
jgi:hypothetical protein